MPPWALEEMLSEEVMALHQLKKELVENRFGKFGGTSRLVLRRDKEWAENDMKRLNEALASAYALQSLKVSDLKAISKTTHLLVKMQPKSGFRSFDVQLSSPYVQQQLVQKNWAERREALWDRIADGMVTGIGHDLFEEAFHQFNLDKAIGNFSLRARRLTENTEKNEADAKKAFQGGLNVVLISGNAPPNIKDGEYYQHKSKTFPAIDSWTSEGVFQTTIATSHAITFREAVGAKKQPVKLNNTLVYRVVEALGEKEGDGKAKFFFVVPQQQFDKVWTDMQPVKQSEMADKIEQWVVCFEKNLPDSGRKS